MADVPGVDANVPGVGSGVIPRVPPVVVPHARAHVSGVGAQITRVIPGAVPGVHTNVPGVGPGVIPRVIPMTILMLLLVVVVMMMRQQRRR
jgi:hypothetical protein